jgi:hypothetical protein
MNIVSNCLHNDSNIKGYCDSWARKHPKNLGKVSGGGTSRAVLFKTPPVFIFYQIQKFGQGEKLELDFSHLLSPF